MENDESFANPLPTSNFIKSIFGVKGMELMEKLKENGIKTYRRLFELSDTATQCNAVIGSKVNADCWICGLKINPRVGFLPKSKSKAKIHSNSKGVSKKGVFIKINEPVKTGLTAECEHILPIAQAVIFLQLYNSKKDKTHESLKLEYGWAHVVCNQEKGNMCPLIIRDNNFVVDYDQITYLLEKIYNSHRSDSKLLKSLLRMKYNTLEKFKQARNTIILNKYQDIIYYITRTTSRDKQPHTANLLFLAGIAGAGDEMNPEIRNKLAPQFEANLLSYVVDPNDSSILDIDDKLANEVLAALKYIKDNINSNQVPVEIWNSLLVKYGKYTKYIYDEDDNNSNLFDFLTHYRRAHPDIDIENLAQQIMMYIHYRIIEEILENLTLEDQDEFSSILIRQRDIFERILTKHIVNQLNADYRAYEKADIEHGAHVLMATKAVGRHNRTQRAHSHHISRRRSNTRKRVVKAKARREVEHAPTNPYAKIYKMTQARRHHTLAADTSTIPVRHEMEENAPMNAT